ncbi:hypothetical protein [Escherichia coli]
MLHDHLAECLDVLQQAVNDAVANIPLIRRGSVASGNAVIVGRTGKN